MSPARRLLSYFARYKRSLALGFLCVVGSAVFSLLKPSIVGNSVDVLAHAFSRTVLVKYGLFFVGASAI